MIVRERIFDVLHRAHHHVIVDDTGAVITDPVVLSRGDRSLDNQAVILTQMTGRQHIVHKLDHKEKFEKTDVDGVTHRYMHMTRPRHAVIEIIK